MRNFYSLLQLRERMLKIQRQRDGKRDTWNLEAFDLNLLHHYCFLFPSTTFLFCFL